MFSRLTLDTLLTTESSVSRTKNVVANLPLNGATKTGLELRSGESREYRLGSNQHGQAYLITATEDIDVRLVHIESTRERNTVMSNARGRFHAMHKKLTADERLNTYDEYLLILENNSGLTAKVAVIYTEAGSRPIADT